MHTLLSTEFVQNFPGCPPAAAAGANQPAWVPAAVAWPGDARGGPPAVFRCRCRVFVQDEKVLLNQCCFQLPIGLPTILSTDYVQNPQPGQAPGRCARHAPLAECGPTRYIAPSGGHGGARPAARGAHGKFAGFYYRSPFCSPFYKLQVGLSGCCWLLPSWRRP